MLSFIGALLKKCQGGAVVGLLPLLIGACGTVSGGSRY